MGDRWLRTDELAFLDDVVTHRLDGVRERYRRLGWSDGKGDRVKQLLADEGWLESDILAIARTRKLILRISTEGRKRLGIEAKGFGREGLVHEYWKRAVARRLKQLGYKVELEAPRVGGRVDVLARKDGKRVGIEVETGKSSVIENVRNCLRSGFDLVIVIATDESAAHHIERSLAAEGLMIPHRVLVIREGRGLDHFLTDRLA